MSNELKSKVEEELEAINQRYHDMWVDLSLTAGNDLAKAMISVEKDYPDVMFKKKWDIVYERLHMDKSDATKRQIASLLHLCAAESIPMSQLTCSIRQEFEKPTDNIFDSALRDALEQMQKVMEKDGIADADDYTAVIYEQIQKYLNELKWNEVYVTFPFKIKNVGMAASLSITQKSIIITYGKAVGFRDTDFRVVYKNHTPVNLDNPFAEETVKDFLESHAGDIGLDLFEDYRSAILASVAQDDIVHIRRTIVADDDIEYIFTIHHVKDLPSIHLEEIQNVNNSTIRKISNINFTRK